MGSGRLAIFAGLVAGLFGAILCSCSGHAPELVSVEYRLSLRPLDPNAKRVREQLAVSAAVKDEDGFKDLAALHVLHDGSEYAWTLSPDNWTKKEQNKETWISGVGLSTPDSDRIPRGLYRVVLEDLSGDSDETSFTLPSGLEVGASFPIVRLEGDRVSVSSNYAHTELLFLGQTEELLRVVEAPRNAIPLSTLFGSPDWKGEVREILAYAYDPQRNIGIYSWIQTIRP